MSNLVRNSAYKITTDKQYSLLTHEMSRVSAESSSGKKKIETNWNNLTENLNALGPPFRTVQQWKKVWSDFRRFHSKRNFKSIPKFQKNIKKELVYDNNYSNDNNDISQDVEEDETSQSDFKSGNSMTVADFLRSESEDYEQNSQSIHSIYSNDYADEYSYPDQHSTQQSHAVLDETLIPDEAPFETYNYADDATEAPSASTFNQSASIASQVPPPPLRPANSSLLDQTLYTLQNQMEHQTKLLEHLSDISSTMACLMERQVDAVEKQTEVMRRQASATEHHTLVMNNFVDMIREKMPKSNSKTTTANKTNLVNGNL